MNIQQEITRVKNQIHNAYQIMGLLPDNEINREQRESIARVIDYMEQYIKCLERELEGRSDDGPQQTP